MTLTKQFACAIFLACAVAAPASSAAEIPAQIFGDLPLISDAEISPDGTTIAMVQSGDFKTLIVFYDLVGDKSPVVVQLGQSRPYGMTWGNDEKLLVKMRKTVNITTTAGKGKYEFRQFFSIDRHTGAIQMMLSNSDAFNVVIGAGSLLHTLPDDEKHVLIAQYDPSWKPGQNWGTSNSRVKRATATGGYNLYLVDLYTGREIVRDKGEPSTIDWIIDTMGAAVGRVDFDAGAKQRKIMALRGRSYSKTAAYDEEFGKGAHITIEGAGAVAMRPTVMSYNGANTRGVYEYDLDKGAIAAPLFRDPLYDADSAILDPYTGRAVGAAFYADFQQQKFFDARRAKILQALGDALPGAALTHQSETRDGELMVIRAAYSDRPEAYYLFESKAKSLSPLGSSYPPEASGVAVRSRIDSVSSDGMRIRGYLTTPKTAGKSKLPLIVLPHGGPEGRDTQEFDWWAAFYASRGYLVYQPNFRGSDGFGYAFREAGFGEWGRKTQGDITEGVKKLIADGAADPNRVCIVGASYGGYAALAGATLTPELYKCAISINGVADLIHMLSQEKYDGENHLAYWERRIGDLGRERARIEKVSPAQNAANAKAAVLLMHGVDDTVVPISNSRRMRDALKSAGKKVRYVELPGEDHWLSDGITRTRMLDETIKFIDANIGQ
jgi:dipeptidyl aminopeptidase/acylaminoacyl peptidase